MAHDLSDTLRLSVDALSGVFAAEVVLRAAGEDEASLLALSLLDAKRAARFGDDTVDARAGLAEVLLRKAGALYAYGATFPADEAASEALLILHDLDEEGVVGADLALANSLKAMRDVGVGDGAVRIALEWQVPPIPLRPDAAGDGIGERKAASWFPSMLRKLARRGGQTEGLDQGDETWGS